MPRRWNALAAYMQMRPASSAAPRFVPRPWLSPSMAAIFWTTLSETPPGELRPAGDISEIGQYYAVLFGGLDLSDPRYQRLRQSITGDFAPGQRCP